MRFIPLNNQSLGRTVDINPRQIIFINQAQNSILENFFQQEYDNVVNLFQKYDLEFIFLPRTYTPENLSKVIAYCRPDLTEGQILRVIKNFNPQSIYSGFQSAIEDIRIKVLWAQYTSHKSDSDKKQNTPFSALANESTKAGHTHYSGLVRYWSDRKERPSLSESPEFDSNKSFPIFEFAELKRGSDQDIWEQLDEYLRQIEPKRYAEMQATVMYNCDIICANTGQCAYSSPDDQFPVEAFELMNDIKEKLEKLRLMGVNEMILKNLLPDAAPSLSKMIITPDFKIILEDFQNREIKMGPLPKTVFLLFLRHPEGIVFKYISDYYDEILTLYLKISGKELDSAIKASIAQLTDPSRNTLNENCSRIRRAFLEEFDDELAKYYYVTGERATPKKIRLPRNLVLYQKTLDIPITAPPLSF